jgi:hypothetical protein
MHWEEYNSRHDGHRIPEYQDNKWTYRKYHGKKIYNYLNLPSSRTSEQQEVAYKNTNLPILMCDSEDMAISGISISKKIWNKYYWIYYEEGHKVYRWELEWWHWINHRIIKPKNYERWLEDPKNYEN